MGKFPDGYLAGRHSDWGGVFSFKNFLVLGAY